MWLFLVIGALVVAAASKSSRAATPPPRQLPAPPLPGPIAVLGEILRIGQTPQPMVVLCAVAEAEALGRGDLASDIVRAFVAPVVSQHRQKQGPSFPSRYERGSCALPSAPRAQAASSYGAGAWQQVPPMNEAPMTMPPAARTNDVPLHPPTEEELLTLLNADPQMFLSRMSSRRAPVIDVPVEASQPRQQTSADPLDVPSPRTAPPDFSMPVPQGASFVEQLFGEPGFVGAGVVLVSPLTGEEIFEVRWLRGYPIPPLPEKMEGRPIRLTFAETFAPAPSTGMPLENAAQRQETPPPYQEVDQAGALVPGSPLRGVSDSAWREFVRRLAREAPTFNSTRSVGQYRQRRERLAELGVDPNALHGSVIAQRAALDTDLANAHHHAVAGGLLAEHLGRMITMPGHDGEERITLSGVLGVIQCAGLEGAVSWLERPSDRKRFPHTTQAFLRTNGIF